MNRKIFARIVALVVALISTLTVFASCSVTTPEDIIGSVTLPDTYYIEYEVKDKDGVIRTVSKAVDENGNIAFQSGDEILIFIKTGDSYVEYKTDEAGELTREEGKKVDLDYVDEATAEFTEYVKKSQEKNMPTVEEYGKTTVVDRACTVYNAKVGINSFNVSYYYYVDDATGVCLGFEAKMTLAGIEVDTDDTVFTCVEFTAEVPTIEI